MSWGGIQEVIQSDPIIFVVYTPFAAGHFSSLYVELSACLGEISLLGREETKWEHSQLTLLLLSHLDLVLIAHDIKREHSNHCLFVVNADQRRHYTEVTLRQSRKVLYQNQSIYHLPHGSNSNHSARQAGLNFSETADLLGASSTAIPRVYRDYSQKIKYSVSDSSLGKNALQMSEIKGEQSDFFELIGR